jgi:three-Cys-motif partner protein
MSVENSKANLPEHSSAKVKLLAGYLKRFLNIIANDGYTVRIKMYDLFCGEGIYGNKREGSAVVIMRAVNEAYSNQLVRSTRTTHIDCFFNDKDSAKVESVRQAIQSEKLHHSDIGTLEFSSRDYSIVIKELADKLPASRYEKGFVFIDPYGYKHIRASDIKMLLAKGNTEVLLFLPTQFMYRFDFNGTPEALVDFIEDIVDYKDWRPSDNVWDFVEQLKREFRTYLGPRVFVDTFTIRKDPQTVFCLFFFSSHIRGFEKMLEAKWEQDTEQGRGWDYSSRQKGSLFPGLKVHPLEQDLRTFLQPSRRTNAEIYEFTLHRGFLPKHAREVFAFLQGKGELEVLGRDGSRVRRGSFYLNYDDFKKKPDRVRFEIK